MSHASATITTRLRSARPRSIPEPPERGARQRGRMLPGKVALALTILTAAGALPRAVAAQDGAGTVVVRVVSEGEPVSGARVISGSVAAESDEGGRAVLRLPAGTREIRVEAFGLGTEAVEVTVRTGEDSSVLVSLNVEALEVEEIIVSSTRTDRRIEDVPMRIEVIGREEVEEKLLMTPGDISMLLNETAGLRVQPTAPALGGAGVRIQGLRGRYTQILSDGLPLHGGQTGAFGPLQIPPMDLAQVEVIKGAVSALYGASALGGVVNLISRRPDEDREGELLLNQGTLGGTDVISWNEGPLSERWGYTLLGGLHRQGMSDVDSDGWADLSSFRRVTARPRLFWNDGRGSSTLLTIGATLEEREGGTLDDASSIPTGVPWTEGLGTTHVDAGVLSRFLLDPDLLLAVRGSAALQRHEHTFGAVTDEDEHRTGFVEASVTGSAGRNTWVGGVALQHDAYAARSLPDFDYTYTVPGIFGQADLSPTRWLSFSASARLDHHSRYGTSLSPRLSVLVRPAEEWTARVSAGGGTFAPTPWTDETESVGLRRVVPPAGLEAERARSASVDIGRTFGPLEVNLTAFGSDIAHPVQVRRTSADLLELFNADGRVRTRGSELLARYHVEGLHVTATHVHLRATEPDPSGTGRRTVPLSPRHTAGIIAAWEREGRSRVGVELYYTGTQVLEENPYRQEAETHVVFGFLAEQRIGPLRVFLNAENVFDTRQTRHDPLVLPSRSPEGRWTTDVWAPLEGRAFNAGVRWTY